MDTISENRFFALSIELIFEIANYLDPSSYLNLALTCSHFHHQTEPIFRLHRAAFIKYKVTSDILPGTALELLQDPRKTPFGKWHVRELEFWGSRRSWGDWRAWELQPPATFQLANEGATRQSLGQLEMKMCLQTAKMWWELSDDDFDAVRNELDSGHDGFIKMLLIASCPRLHSIKFVKRGDDSHTSLQWMSKAIGWSKASGVWPPGFQSLRSVAVGVSAGIVSGDQTVGRRQSDLAGILNLPGISHVYIQDLDQEFDENGDVVDIDDGFGDIDSRAVERHDLLPCSSSIQHLYLDRTGGIHHEFRNAILNVSEGLQSMTIRGNDYSPLDDIDIYVNALGRNYPETMEKLTFYNPGNLNGYRCNVYRPEELKDYRALKQVSIAIDDVELDAFYNKPDEAEYPNRDQFIEWIVREGIFPQSMEVLMLWTQLERHEFIEVDKGLDRLDILDDVLVALINEKPGHYKNLKTIYVDATERALRKQRNQICFQKAIAAGRGAGVHVHTLTNQEDGGSWNGFPAAPDKYDLKTGPLSERPSTWRINRLTGDWEDPGCEGCGRCEECLRVYPEQAWQDDLAKRGSPTKEH